MVTLVRPNVLASKVRKLQFLFLIDFDLELYLRLRGKVEWLPLTNFLLFFLFSLRLKADLTFSNQFQKDLLGFF